VYVCSQFSFFFLNCKFLLFLRLRLLFSLILFLLLLLLLFFFFVLAPFVSQCNLLVGSLGNLKILILDHNNIRSIPNTISNLSKLEELKLFANSLKSVSCAFALLFYAFFSCHAFFYLFGFYVSIFLLLKTLFVNKFVLFFFFILNNKSCRSMSLISQS